MQALKDWQPEWWQDSPDLFPEPLTLGPQEPDFNDHLAVAESHRRIEKLQVHDAHYKQLALLERAHQHERTGREEPHEVTRARLQAQRDRARKRQLHFREQSALFEKAEKDLRLLKRNNRKRERDAESALVSLQDEVFRARDFLD